MNSATGASQGDQETAYAKLNLALHVRAKLENGYHELETIFAFLDQGDLIKVEAFDSVELEIDGPFGVNLAVKNNLVLKAAQLLKDVGKVKQGAKIMLSKNLPIASGIGGGSADAAATLRLLNRFWQLDLDFGVLEQLSRPLGADVPACIKSETCFGKGIGQDIEVISDEGISGASILLANPLIEISTQDIFEKWDGQDKGQLSKNSAHQALEEGRNDLQNPAIAAAQEIGQLLDILEKTNPSVSRMSGSGATCFGVYENKEAALSAEIQVLQSSQKIWTLVGKLR